MTFNRLTLALGLVALGLGQPAHADSCWVTSTDAYLGTQANGKLGWMGLKALVETYTSNRYLMSLSGDPIGNATVKFQVLFPGDTQPWDLATVYSDSLGWAQVSISNLYGVDSSGKYYLKVSRGGATPVNHTLSTSQHIQVVTSVVGTPSGCDGAVVKDVYGSMYFRHPSDHSPVLFSDLDDTLFNTTDPRNVIRSMLTAHYQPIDDFAPDATVEFRDAGGVYIGITAQFTELRPLTRSELLRWGFDEPYSDMEYYHDDPGYDGSYLGRTLSYIANDDYPTNGKITDYNRDHCALKVEKLGQFVDLIFHGSSDDVIGIIGDSEHSDGCSAAEYGIHWYALMEKGDEVSSEYPSTDYDEITEGWPQALPLVCADGGLACN